ncbi:MAG TPA: ATP-binding cassette domain-containing protein [Anaeromyxobacter sp.]
MTEPLVSLDGAAVGYGGRAILEGVNLSVAPDDFLAVVGPNGGGKTTVLLALLGARPLLGGRLVRPRPLRVGYVPQREHVDTVWPLTAGEVALMGRVPAIGPWRRPAAADRDAVLSAMRRVGVEHLVDR